MTRPTNWKTISTIVFSALKLVEKYVFSALEIKIKDLHFFQFSKNALSKKSLKINFFGFHWKPEDMYFSTNLRALKTMVMIVFAVSWPSHRKNSQKYQKTALF